jgi:transcriptional regulator with XRE-family HTH domain
MLDESTITPEQCRGARAMLGLSRAELAKLAKVAQDTLANFEAGNRTPYARTLADVRAALEEKGASFVNEAERSGVLVPNGAKAR